MLDNHSLSWLHVCENSKSAAKKAFMDIPFEGGVVKFECSAQDSIESPSDYKVCDFDEFKMQSYLNAKFYWDSLYPLEDLIDKERIKPGQFIYSLADFNLHNRSKAMTLFREIVKQQHYISLPI